MAETIAEVQNRLIADKNSDPTTATLTSPSKVSLWRTFLNIIATGIAILQQLWDIFQLELQAIADAAAPGTPLWWKKEIFKFQYSSTIPQAVQMVNNVPGYSVVDDTLKIITRCSVKTDNNKIVKIKVAKGTTPGPLAALEKTALDAYAKEITPAGISINIINLNPDKLWLDAEIFYNGQYAGSIQADVIAAIDAFLSFQSNPENFNGVIKITKLVDAIQAVPGVTDVLINSVAAICE